MTCPTCNLPLTPGAYCDGNGSHPPRRARRLTGAEKRAAQREAESRREEERDRAERRRRVRPCFATAWDRQRLHRRGDLSEALREAVACGLYTHEEAARLEAATAAEVAAIDAERQLKRAEHEAWLATNPPADAVDVGAPVEPSCEPRRRTSHRGALFTVALVGALMGVGGVTGEEGR